ncbi:MAG: 30S ribosome-binding factor RbfA [Alphaproteobacteria bacterium]
MGRGKGSRGGADARGGEEHRRSDRVGHEIQRVLSELLLRRSKDPRLADVAITAVRVTHDLRLARVYFTLFDEKADRREVLRALAHAPPFLKRGVAEAISLRYMPDLDFRFDEALVGARRIDALLRGLQDADGAPSPGADAAPGAAPDDEAGGDAPGVPGRDDAEGAGGGA